MSKLQLAIVLPQSICKRGASNTRACHKSGDKWVQLPLESKAFIFLITKAEPGTDLIAPKSQRSQQGKPNKQTKNKPV